MYFRACVLQLAIFPRSCACVCFCNEENTAKLTSKNNNNKKLVALLFELSVVQCFCMTLAPCRYFMMFYRVYTKMGCRDIVAVRSNLVMKCVCRIVPY